MFGRTINCSKYLHGFEKDCTTYGFNNVLTSLDHSPEDFVMDLSEGNNDWADPETNIDWDVQPSNDNWAFPGRDEEEQWLERGDERTNEIVEIVEPKSMCNFKKICYFIK
jgi:hypothetical protein